MFYAIKCWKLGGATLHNTHPSCSFKICNRKRWNECERAPGRRRAGFTVRSAASRTFTPSTWAIQRPLLFILFLEDSEKKNLKIEKKINDKTKLDLMKKTFHDLFYTFYIRV